MDRAQLADFLRRRREALQPEDVGLRRGPRRRAHGLRREEVAALCDMSVDYYARLEQQRGPQPSEQMLAAIARGLRLTLGERDHLFRLAGHTPPARLAGGGGGDHVSPGIMRVLDRLADTPAQVMNDLGETLAQTPAARALFGDETRMQGHLRSVGFRWFVDPDSRRVYPDEDHPTLSRDFTARIRTAYAAHGARSRAATMVEELLARSPEFAALWNAHEVETATTRDKRLQHPETGIMELQCQVLHDPEQGQTLLVFTAQPGTDSHEKLQLLNVLGTQRLDAD